MYEGEQHNEELLRYATEDIKNYLDYLTTTKSASTISVAYSAIEFYYQNIWKRSFFSYIHQGKGKKDRYVLLPQSLIAIMQTQQELKRATDFLFTNAKRGKMHERSIQY